MELVVFAHPDAARSCFKKEGIDSNKGYVTRKEILTLVRFMPVFHLNDTDDVLSFAYLCIA